MYDTVDNSLFAQINLSKQFVGELPRHQHPGFPHEAGKKMKVQHHLEAGDVQHIDSLLQSDQC